MVRRDPISRSAILKSRPSAIVDECKWILSRLEATDFSSEDIFAVHLALEEAFVNAIRHGSKMDPKKQVKIDYSIDDDRVEISITDEGGGFNPCSVPDPRCGENLYKTEGRGLLLIRSYMDTVEFNDAGNCVRMVRHKKARQGGESSKP